MEDGRVNRFRGSDRDKLNGRYRRVEKELAGAQDDAERAKLERKKQFIEKAIARLTGK